MVKLLNRVRAYSFDGVWKNSLKMDVYQGKVHVGLGQKKSRFGAKKKKKK